MTGDPGGSTVVESSTDFRSVAPLLDPHTAANLAALTLPAGARCWTIGPGTDAIVRHLAARADVSRVLATEIDIGQPAPAAHIGINTGDINGPCPPEGGPFDLIHARLVLAYRPQRREIIHQLAAALSPGGWLMAEDFACDDVLRLLTTAGRDDEVLFRDLDLFHDVHDAALAILADRGLSPTWAWEAHEALTEAGFADITTTARAEAIPAHSPWARLHEATINHLAPALRERGVTVADLDAFRDLVRDPTFTTMGHPLVSTWGHTTS